LWPLPLPLRCSHTFGAENVLKKDVAIGRAYLMNHTSGKIQVRIIGELARNRGRIDNPIRVTHWAAENLATGRRIEIKSAARLIREVTPGE
jgi:hypothetical protein